MAKLLPELDSWSEEETKTLAIHALANLRLETRVKVVLETFDVDDCQELAAWVNEKIEGEEKESEDD